MQYCDKQGCDMCRDLRILVSVLKRRQSWSDSADGSWGNRIISQNHCKQWRLQVHVWPLSWRDRTWQLAPEQGHSLDTAWTQPGHREDSGNWISSSCSKAGLGLKIKLKTNKQIDFNLESFPKKTCNDFSSKTMMLISPGKWRFCSFY